METGSISKHFNDVYCLNQHLSFTLPAYSKKKLTERENDSFHTLMFPYDHSCGHFSVQQSISLASDLGRGGKQSGRGLWKVFNTGVFSTI